MIIMAGEITIVRVASTIIITTGLHLRMIETTSDACMFEVGIGVEAGLVVVAEVMIDEGVEETIEVLRNPLRRGHLRVDNRLICSIWGNFVGDFVAKSDSYAS